MTNAEANNRILPWFSPDMPTAEDCACRPTYCVSAVKSTGTEFSRFLEWLLDLVPGMAPDPPMGKWAPVTWRQGR